MAGMTEFHWVAKWATRTVLPMVLPTAFQSVNSKGSTKALLSVVLKADAMVDWRVDASVGWLAGLSVG